MKVSDILQAIFVLSVIVYLPGLIGDPSVVQACTFILAGLGLIAILASWGALPSIPANRRQMLVLMLIDAFVFMFLLTLSILILRGFILTNINLDYAIFGILFLSILLVRLLALKVMDK